MIATAANEIVVSRVFDAPRELVFHMWTSAEHLGNWWGPHGFTITTHSIDVRPGGEWRFVMHGPDGTESPAAAPPSRIRRGSRADARDDTRGLTRRSY